MMQSKDLVSIKEMTRKDLEEILALSSIMKKGCSKDLLQGTLMASCFFEPSTRTRLSFESAMRRLGGEVIGFSDGQSTSVQKGEALADAIKVVGMYSDIIVIRHPLEGSAKAAAHATDKPVINAGDGANEHPTQTLLDLFSIKECQGTIDGLNIAFTGDLLYSRTVHSLAYAMRHFKCRLYCVSAPTLSLPEEIVRELRKSGIPFSYHESLEEVIDKIDILYMTRIQKERFYEGVPLTLLEKYIVTPELLQKGKKNLKVFHPLPRVNEIDRRVDATHHAYYFEQANNGLWVRQALLAQLLGRLP